LAVATVCDVCDRRLPFFQWLDGAHRATLQFFPTLQGVQGVSTVNACWGLDLSCLVTTHYCHLKLNALSFARSGRQGTSRYPFKR
jgi:hypothetical protein